MGARTVAMAFCFVCGLGIAQNANAQFAELARRVPSSANTLVLVNTEKALASPIAISEGWRKGVAESYAAGLSIIPPESKCAVFASDLDFKLMVPAWETAVMELRGEPNMAEFVKRTGATADKIGEYAAAALPSDAYVIQYAPNIVAAVAPGDRQKVGRWVRESDSRKTHALSPYLSEAFGFANDVGTPIIMALDLQDQVTQEEVAAALAENPGLKNVSSADQLKLAGALASIRGLTLGVTLGETSFGKVKVDFAQPVAITPDEASSILLGALKKNGLMLDELSQWTTKVNGKQVTFEGEMTRSGLKRLFSLFSSPPAIRTPPKDSESDPTSPAGIARTTHLYYKQVNGLISDLRRKKADSVTMGESAAYYETFARKIDKLSVLNVDEDMAKFGTYASDCLRSACGALRGAAANTRIREVNVQPVYDTYGFTWRNGYVSQSNYNASATQHERTRVRSEERVNGYKTANQVMQNLEIASADIRKKMTAKYSYDFSDK